MNRVDRKRNSPTAAALRDAASFVKVRLLRPSRVLLITCSLHSSPKPSGLVTAALIQGQFGRRRLSSRLEEEKEIHYKFSRPLIVPPMVCLRPHWPMVGIIVALTQRPLPADVIPH